MTGAELQEYNIVQYKTVQYGTNLLKKRKQCITNDKKIHWKEISIGNTGGYFFLITTKEDVMKLYDNILIVDGSCKVCDDSIDNTDHPSGMVILLYCKMQNNVSGRGYRWGPHQAKFCKLTKENVISKDANHHGSEGEYYSFGNKANYGMIDQSSLALYTYKKYKNSISNELSELNANIIEVMAACELKLAIEDMIKVVPSLDKLIAPLLNVAYDTQKTIGDINMKKISTTECGLWQSSVCVNATTSQLHTENDCTYTVITTPCQETEKKLPDKYQFLFALKKGETIGITLRRGVSFLFSGKLLSHRQNKDTTTSNDNDTFINIASYGNERLYNSIKKTMKRKSKNDTTIE